MPKRNKNRFSTPLPFLALPSRNGPEYEVGKQYEFPDPASKLFSIRGQSKDMYKNVPLVT